MKMSQTMLEKLTCEEYSHALAYGDPCEYGSPAPEFLTDEYELQWIGTLESTTYAGMTFGYNAVQSASTVV